MSDVAHRGPRNAQRVCVYAQTHEKLGGTLLVTGQKCLQKGYRQQQLHTVGQNKN